MRSLEKLLEVYSENVRSLMALARSIVSEPAEAEDVLQDVIVKLLSEPERFSRVEQPLAFLRACVRNEAIDHLRKLGRIPPTPDELLDSVRSCYSEEEYKRAEALMWLRGYTNSLPEEMRRAFIAYAVDGYTVAHISREMGIPQDTLRKRFNSIKRKIREAERKDGSWAHRSGEMSK